MFKCLFLNKWRRMRLIWPCVSAALGCLLFAGVSAQGEAVVSDPTAPKQNATASQPDAGGTISSELTNQGPTYLGDVQPIFMANCARCHNQETRFVYNWLDYKTAFADRWELKRRVWDSWKGSYYKEAMPIANSPESLALTDEQRLTIKNWVENGGIEGQARAQAQGGGAQSKTEKIALGKRLFASCAACHQPTGKGIPNVFPPLAGSDFLNADKNRAIGIVIHGRHGEVVVNGMKFNNSMPSFPLSDQDIAAVLTFVYNSFGNSGVEVTPEEVKSVRAQQ
jgi:mono/diheme cytochrome c family protein